MDSDKRNKPAQIGGVRTSDIEPYTALRWVSTLFKGAAVFLGVAVIGEFVAGIRFDGMGAVPVLLGELARTIVLAVVLWGGGDLVRLLVHVGHDIRAERILIARLVHRFPVPASQEHFEEKIVVGTAMDGSALPAEVHDDRPPLMHAERKAGVERKAG
jgi:hypothetical protein